MLGSKRDWDRRLESVKGRNHNQIYGCCEKRTAPNRSLHSRPRGPGLNLTCFLRLNVLRRFARRSLLGSWIQNQNLPFLVRLNMLCKQSRNPCPKGREQNLSWLLRFTMLQNLARSILFSLGCLKCFHKTCRVVKTKNKRCKMCGPRHPRKYCLSMPER